MHILKEYNLGDMTARYLAEDRTQQVGAGSMPVNRFFSFATESEIKEL